MTNCGVNGADRIDNIGGKELREVMYVYHICWIVGIGDLENIHYSRVSSAPMNL